MLVKQKKFRKSEKKFNFPWPASAHSQCTGNVQNDGHKNFREHFHKKIFFKDGKRKKNKNSWNKNSGIIHSIA